MKHIIEKICTLWKPEWQGMVMGELWYRKGRGSAPGNYKVSLTEKRRIRLILSDEEKGEKMGLLLFPVSGKEAGAVERPDESEYWRSFSVGEVRGYSRDRGDHNEIHQTDRPVVSGFQLAEALQEKYALVSFRIRFHHPVFSGEAVYLQQDGGRVSGYSDRLCFILEEA